MMVGVCTKSAKSAKSASGTLDAHFVMSKCILCADLKKVNEHFVQTMCTLYLQHMHTLCRLEVSK